ncbi:MAG TPA: helix-turn-helix transcriptional regulator [Phycisphaerales bacterium]|nr:helix-turn-helix transcriptional regulator [Phycisphaerales bacterium]
MQMEVLNSVIGRLAAAVADHVDGERIADPAVARKTAAFLLGLSHTEFGSIRDYRAKPTDINDLSSAGARAVLTRMADAPEHTWSMLLNAREQWGAAAPAHRDGLVAGVALMLLAPAARRPADTFVPVAEPWDADAVFANFARLRATRGSKWTTQEDLAKGLGVSLATVNALINGKGKPQFRTLKKIAEGFDVPISELTDRAG